MNGFLGKFTPRKLLFGFLVKVARGGKIKKFSLVQVANSVIGLGRPGGFRESLGHVGIDLNGILKTLRLGQSPADF